MSIVYTIPLNRITFWSVIIGGAFILFFLSKIAFSTRKNNGKGLSVPTIGSFANGRSFFHTWNVKIKIAAIFFYCFAIAALQKPLTALTALAVSLFFIKLADLPFKQAGKRLAAMAGFLSMFLIIMPLTAAHHPGDHLVLIEPYQLLFNLRAFMAAIVITMKASAIALMMEPLFNTAPLPVTIDGLRRLGVPTVFCQMILMSHRYIFVFLHEVKRMNIGMKARGFRKRTNIATLQTMGNFLGMLMVRSVDRTERVYQAMLARGFNGNFPVCYKDQSHWHDWLKGCFFLLLTIFFLLADKINFS